MATQDAHKELFLDMLTKEEKEAMLTKKMEELRRQNAAIQKRYEEVQADKKRAEVKSGSKPAQKKPVATPKTASQTEDHDPTQRQRQMQQPQQQMLQNSRPATRGKPPPQQGGGGRGYKERPKSQDFRSEAAYEYEPIVDMADLDYRQKKRAPSPSKARRNAPRENAPVVSFSAHSPPPEGAMDNSISYYRPRRAKSYGAYDPRDGQFRDNQPRGGGQSRGTRGGRVYTQTFNSRRQTSGRALMEDGPPPDPAYNYLADRTRDVNSGNRQIEKPSSQESSGGGVGRGGKEPRRHPRNFGGQDFSNVKPQMKAVKEKERDRRSYPPRNRLEMTVNMTGSERIQYDEWKAERQKVDQERMDRQKNSAGEWRRAWDQDKSYKEYDEPPSPGRTEPAKRPVGRIGSGRFDRGDRDDRRAEGLSQSPKAPGMMQAAQPAEVERKPPASRGRGRGRGRTRGQQAGGQGEKPPRPRTWSGGDDARTVECSNDMLVVKIDKSRGSDDHSVEVEYGPEEEVEKRKSSPPKRKPGRRSPTKQKQQHPQFQDADGPQAKGAPSPPVITSTSSQDSSIYEGRPASLSQSISVGSTDEWEDITGTDTATTEDEGEVLRRGSARLNPEAPIFLPTSPDLQSSSPILSDFSLPAKGQRKFKSPASSRVSCSAPSSNQSCSPEPSRVQPMLSSEEEHSCTDGISGCDGEEEGEDLQQEEEALDAAAYDDLEQDFEDADEEFLSPEDKFERNEEDEEGGQGSNVSDSESQKEVPTMEEAVTADVGDAVEDIDSPQTAGASLADELSAAGAPPHSSSISHTSVQEDISSPEFNEIEEDEVEEETVLTVTDDSVPKGEHFPNTTTATEKSEEQEAPLDADSSCQAAPEDHPSSPNLGEKQMATSEEDGGSQDEPKQPSSSQLISKVSEAAQDSAENVMEKPDAHCINGDTEDATTSEDTVALDASASTSLST